MTLKFGTKRIKFEVGLAFGFKYQDFVDQNGTFLYRRLVFVESGMSRAACGWVYFFTLPCLTFVVARIAKQEATGQNVLRFPGGRSHG